MLYGCGSDVENGSWLVVKRTVAAEAARQLYLVLKASEANSKNKRGIEHRVASKSDTSENADQQQDALPALKDLLWLEERTVPSFVAAEMAAARQRSELVSILYNEYCACRQLMAEESAEWNGLWHAHKAFTTSFISRDVVAAEYEARKALLQEVSAFLQFAHQNGPAWAAQAKRAEQRRVMVDEARAEKCDMMAESADWFCALKIQQEADQAQVAKLEKRLMGMRQREEEEKRRVETVTSAGAPNIPPLGSQQQQYRDPQPAAATPFKTWGGGPGVRPCAGGNYRPPSQPYQAFRVSQFTGGQQGYQPPSSNQYSLPTQFQYQGTQFGGNNASPTNRTGPYVPASTSSTNTQYSANPYGSSTYQPQWTKQ